MSEAYSPREEFTKSVATLRRMLERCENDLNHCDTGDEPEILKVALQIIKEINRLFKLYSEEFRQEDEISPEAEELEQIRQYLEPLELTKKDVTTLELVRLSTYKLQEFLNEKTGGKNDGRIPAKTARRGKKKS